MQTIHLFISGVVQGVGYRQFVKSMARKHNVSGWVQNTPEGKVEAVLRGSQEKIEEMIKLCWKGPFLSEVKDIQVSEEKIDQKFEGFEIRKD